MTIQEALPLSKVNAVWRPFYIGPAEPEFDKQIVVVGMFEDLFVVYAETKKFWRELAESEWGKVQNMNDWEPVAPIGV